MLRFFKYTDKKEFIKLFIVRVIVILSMLLSPMLIASAIDSAIGKDLEATTKYIICIVFLDVFIHIFYVLEDYLFGKNDMKAYINQFSKINQAVKFYDSKKYNISIYPNDIHDGCIALYFTSHIKYIGSYRLWYI